MSTLTCYGLLFLILTLLLFIPTYVLRRVFRMRWGRSILVVVCLCVTIPAGVFAFRRAERWLARPAALALASPEAVTHVSGGELGLAWSATGRYIAVLGTAGDETCFTGHESCAIEVVDVPAHRIVSCLPVSNDVALRSQASSGLLS